MQDMHGRIMLVDKPKGITSFDVIRRLRRELRVKKLGHAGTLDPLASGLMLIGIGDGTKDLAEFIKLPKTYESEIVVGERTETGDAEGVVVEEVPVCILEEETARRVLHDMRGMLALAVPRHSAVKVGGKPLYAHTRRGVEVPIPIKRMEIYAANLRAIEPHRERVHVFVSWEVGSGTYIRSLAEEFGRRLGLPATLGNLRRTRIGNFRIEDARPLAVTGSDTN